MPTCALKPLRKITGIVVSTGMDRTVAVAVERLYPHPKYEKFVRHKKKYMCHDQHEICGLGDRVQIKYVGRLSKRKFWAVVDMVHRHPQLKGEPFPMAQLINPIGDAAASLEAVKPTIVE